MNCTPRLHILHSNRKYLKGRPQGEQGANAVDSPRTRATGTADALVNILNTRRSPLSFWVQSLALHLDTSDDHNSGWVGAQEHGMLFLVAKREVLKAVDEGPPGSVGEGMAAKTDEKDGGPVKSPVAMAEGGLKGGGGGGGSGSSSYSAGVMRVVEQEELGRTRPFTTNSPTTFLSDSSFTVPSSALVADLQRRRGSGARKGGAGSGGEPVESIVLEIIQSTAGGGGGRGRSFLKKRKKHTRDSISEESPCGGGTVVARATLDPGFLRRTIGCQRSVLMITPPAGVGGVNVSDQSVESAGLTAPRIFARLDVAGHAVSARPGRPQLRLQVLECQNLKSADVLGKSDPCVFVFWDAVEVGRTPIARDELHPVFPASGATFRLPLVPPSTARAEEVGPGSSPKRFADWQAYTPELRLEVWDMDRDFLSRKWKKGQMLGSTTLQGPRGIAPAIEASAEQGAKGSTTIVPVDRPAPGVILRLSAADRRAPSLRPAEGQPEQASAGVVSIRIAIEYGTDDAEAWASLASAEATTASGGISSGMIVPALDSSPSVGTPSCSPENDGHAKDRLQIGLRVWCLDARGLPAGCDGYCRVFWNGMQVGSTPPASHVSQGLRGGVTAGKRNSPPASAFQQNPVWWASLTQAESRDGRGDEKCAPKGGGATAVIPLYDDPEVENELTIEVFDGSHTHETSRSIAASGGSVAGRGAADTRRENGRVVGKDSETPSTARRDTLGRSLGSATVRGEYLVRPPGDRIDLPLQLSTPPSSKESSGSGIILSITLARLRLGEQSADSTTCNSVVATARATTNISGEGEEGQACAFEKEETWQRPTRWLRLLVGGARLWKGLDISGTSDPFCVVYVDRVWYSETRVCWGTLAPRWDQWIQIEAFGRAGAPAMGLGLAGHEIRVEVWDKDLVGANDFIGEAHLLLHENEDG